MAPMADTPHPTPPRDKASSVASSDLPPTLCRWCKHGLVVKEAQPLFGEDDEDFWLRQRKAIATETTFCSHPMIAPRDEPAEMDLVVLECQGFAQRPIITTEDLRKRQQRRRRASATPTRRSRAARRRGPRRR